MREVPAADGEFARYWDTVYESRGASGVSWFQAAPVLSLELIDLLDVHHEQAIIDVGGGASSLVDHLIRRGFRDVSVLDISEAALSNARKRLGEDKAVSWLRHDILSWSPDKRYDLWHDRAVFHFLTDEADRSTYLDALRSTVSASGAVILATFAEDAPEYCSGLPVVRYSAKSLSDVLEAHFEVMAERRELHTTPTGVVQPFTWIAARARHR